MPDAPKRGESPPRRLAGPVLTFDLREELEELRRRPLSRTRAPNGRTLVKEPDLRIVLMTLKAGGRLEEHDASGPISIQVLEGQVRLRLPERDIEIAAGTLLALEPDIPHDVEAIGDSAFLLTIGRTYYQHVSDHHGSKG
jgi:quercetin dioxygenase-like cupin family protein